VPSSTTTWSAAVTIPGRSGLARAIVAVDSQRRAALWLQLVRSRAVPCDSDRRPGSASSLDIGSGLPTEAPWQRSPQQPARPPRRGTTSRRPLGVGVRFAVASHAGDPGFRDAGAGMLRPDLREPRRSWPTRSCVAERLVQPSGLLLVMVFHSSTDAETPWGVGAMHSRAHSPRSYLVLGHSTDDTCLTVAPAPRPCTTAASHGYPHAPCARLLLFFRLFTSWDRTWSRGAGRGRQHRLGPSRSHALN